MIGQVGPTSTVRAWVSRCALVPTHSSISPGSTTRVCVRSVNASRAVGTRNRTVVDLPRRKMHALVAEKLRHRPRHRAHDVVTVELYHVVTRDRPRVRDPHARRAASHPSAPGPARQVVVGECRVRQPEAERGRGCGVEVRHLVDPRPGPTCRYEYGCAPAERGRLTGSRPDGLIRPESTPATAPAPSSPGKNA